MPKLKHVIERKAFFQSALLFAVITAGALTLNACATVPPPPTQELQAAESAIANAEQSRVADYASAELTVAREKLALARTATRNEQMAQAKYLAEEARVHAELAYAQAEEIKAKEVNDEMQQSTVTLQTEMNRATGAPQ